MNTPCSHKILESALSGDLPAQDEIALERHLETCDQCSAELERLAGGPGLCQEAASLLAEDELDAAVPIGDGWSEIDFVVEHLDPADEPNLLGRLGGYDVLEIIGRGGMGVVLKGFDRQLKRCVAIKVLSPHLALSSLARQRFAREAQAAAAVVHPNVLAIHQVQPGGRLPFLVMPLVAGESLAERLAAQGTLELKEILRIGMQAAAGLAAAHEQGLVHRDVKPANILLEKGVERAVLTDFGLARAADDVTLTRQGIIAGTPQYMSPEQARGEPLDGRSDLFSLGSVLYEMATGVSPFRADSTMATLRRLVEEAPRAIGSIKPELPPWLIAIIDRLLQKDPARRFSSAKEVSQLLEGCLAHVQQPASVPLPAGLPKPALRSRLRPSKRVIKGVLAMITAVAIGLLGFFLLPSGVPDISGRWSGEDWGQVELKKTSSAEYSGTYSETTGKQPGELELKWSHVERRFNGTWREGDDRFGQISVRLVDQEIRGAYTTDPKSKINPGTPALADLAWIRGAEQPTGELAQAVMPQSVQPATLIGPLLLPSYPTPALEIFVDDPVKVVAYAPDGKSLAIGGNGTTVRLFDAQTGKPTISLALLGDDERDDLAGDGVSLRQLTADLQITALAFSPDSSLLAVGTDAGQVTLYDVHGKSLVMALSDNKNPTLRVAHASVRGIAFSPDGKLLATCGDAEPENIASTGGTLKLWDAKTGELRHDLQGQHSRYVAAIAFSPDGKLLASAGQWSATLPPTDASTSTAIGVDLWDPRTGKVTKNLRIAAVAASPVSLGFSPEGSQLAIGLVVLDNQQPTGVIYVVYPASGIRGLTLAGMSPEQVAFTPDGKYITALGNPRSFKLWDSSTGQLGCDLVPPKKSKGEGWNCFAFAPDGGRLALGGLVNGKQGVRVWNMGGTPDPQVVPPAAAVQSLPAEPVGTGGEGDIVATATTVQDKDLGAAGCRVDLTLTKPRYALFGVAQYRDSNSKEATELPELNFYLVSPDDSSDTRTQLSWAFYERDPIEEDLFLQLKGGIAGRVAFDNSYRVVGKKPGKALLGSIRPEQATRCLAYDSNQPAIQINLNQASAERAVWQTLTIASVRNVNNVELGTIQLKLRACPILSDVPLEGSAPIFKNTNWREQDEFQKLIGPADRPAKGVTIRVPAMGEHPELIDPPQAATVQPQPQQQTGRFMFGVGQVPQTIIQSAEPVSVVAYSPDGKLLAFGEGLHVHLRDAQTGKETPSLGLMTNEEANALITTGIPWPKRSGKERVTALAFSPDSRLLAVGTDAGQVTLYDVDRRNVVRALSDTKNPALRFAHARVQAIAFSPDGKLIATCGDAQGQTFPAGSGPGEGPLKIWDAKTGKLKYDLKAWENAAGELKQDLKGRDRWGISAIAFSPDGKLLAGARDWNADRKGAMVELWDPSTGKLAKLLPIADGTGNPTSLAFSPNGKQLAVGMLQESRPWVADAAATIGAIEVFDPVLGTVESGWVGEGAVRQLAYSADGNTIATLRSGKGVTFWQAASGFSKSRDVEMPQPQIGAEWHCFALAPTGSDLAVGGNDPNQYGFVSIWDQRAASETEVDQPADEAATGPKPVPVMQIPTDPPVSVVAYSPDGKWLALGCYGGGIARLYDAQTGQPKAQLTLLEDDELNSGGLSPEHRTSMVVMAMAFSPDSRRLAIGTIMGQVKLFDVPSGKLAMALDDVKKKAPDKLRLHPGKELRMAHARVTALAFSPDGSLLATCGDPRQADFQIGVMAGPRGMFKLWDVRTGELKYDLKDQTGGQVVALAFSPDGKLLASAGEWLSTDMVVREGGKGLPPDGKFEKPSPDGNGGEGGLIGGIFGGPVGGITFHTGVEFWDPLTGERVKTLQLPSEGGLLGTPPSAFALAYSPRGNRLAIGVAQRISNGDSLESVWLIDPEVGMMYRNVPTGFQKELAFSPDGRFIAGFDSRHGWAMWDVASEKLARSIPLEPQPKTDGWDCFAFAPDGKRVAIGHLADGKHGVQVWNLAGAPAAAYISQSNSPPLAPVLSATPIVPAASTAVQVIAWAPDGKMSAAGDGFAEVTLYDGHSGKEVGILKVEDETEQAILAGPNMPVGVTSGRQLTALAFSPDSSLVAVANSIGQVKLFDAHTFELKFALDDVDREFGGEKPLHKFFDLRLAHGAVLGIAFSPDGRTLATCGMSMKSVMTGFSPATPARTSGLLKLWDVETGQLKQDLAGAHIDQVADVAFSPDGKLLASAGSWRSDDATSSGVKLWDPVTAKVVKVLVLPSGNLGAGRPVSLGFSPDGARLAIGLSELQPTTGKFAGAIDVVSSSSGRLELSWELPRWGRVAFTPDGKLIAALSGPCSLGLWYAADGKPAGEMLAMKPKVDRWDCFAFRPNSDAVSFGGINDGDESMATDFTGLWLEKGDKKPSGESP